MNATGEAVSTRSSNKKKTSNISYKGSKAYPPASDVKIIKADGTVDWAPSKKKYVKHHGEVKFSGEK